MRCYFNHLTLLTKRLLMLVILYQISRLIFLLLNLDYFNNLTLSDAFNTFLYGFTFDISAIVYFNFLFIILSIIPGSFKNNKKYQTTIKILFFAINSIALSFNFIDTEYFKYTDKRSTADIIQYIGLSNDVAVLLPQFLKDFWYIALIWILMILSSWHIYPKLKANDNFFGKLKTWHYFLQSTLFILALSIFYFCARGIGLKPLRIINAAQYTSTQNIPLVLNTPFTLLKTFYKNDLSHKYYLDENKLKSTYSPIQNHSDTSNFKNLNVVILIMEGFSKEYIGSLNNNEGYTPFLDSLIKKSRVYPNAFANGKKSIEALPSILSGIPALMDNSFISSSFTANKISSFASLLKEKGYHSSFFHGGTNGTMGFNHFTKLAGFDKYYGRTEYNNEKDYDGNWGIFDEEFFSYYADKLNEFKEPFISSFFSLSSHHPYTIPEKYKDMFPEGKLGIHKSIRYADYSLKRFFDKASKMPWFNNTIFVITADHTSKSIGEFYNNKTGKYAIPIIYYNPGDTTLAGFDSTITQQTDILPSVLDHIGYDKKFISYGNSAFNKSSEHFAVNYINGVYQLIYNEYTLFFDGEKSISLYNLKKDSLLKHNILKESVDIAHTMENKIKAIIQDFNGRMINNNLIIRE